MNTNREEFKIKNNSLPIADVYRQSYYLSWRRLYHKISTVRHGLLDHWICSISCTSFSQLPPANKDHCRPFYNYLLPFLTKVLPIHQPSIQSVSCIGSIFMGWNVYLNRVMRIIFQGEGKIILHVILPCSYRHTPRMFWKEMVSKSYIRKKIGRVSGVVGDKCPYKNTSSPSWTLVYLSVYFVLFYVFLI